MNVLANLFIFFVAAYGVLGLVSPKTVMGFRSYPFKDSWITGGAFYKTPRRTRLTCAVLLVLALFSLGVELYNV
jgi:hypothetical protein